MRVQLQAKEKQLLELQRTDLCLLSLDFDQIDLLVDAIASLQLSTPDGSFVFASTSDYDDHSCSTSVCSTDFNEIKNLPLYVWLPPSRTDVTQQHEQPLSICGHLLSLPIKAYLASSYKAQNQFCHRIPMVNHLLFMPIDVFKPLSNNPGFAVNENVSSTTGTIKSFLTTEMNFSKEFWLKNNQNSSFNNQISSCT